MKMMQVCISTMVPLIASLSLILFLYWKSVCLLREHSDIVLAAIQLRARDLYIYSFATILTIGPSIVYYTLKLIYITADFNPWDKIAYSTIGLGGFANSLVYFFQRRISIGDGRKTKMEKLECLAIERSDSINNMLCREVNNLTVDDLNLSYEIGDWRRIHLKR